MLCRVPPGSSATAAKTRHGSGIAGWLRIWDFEAFIRRFGGFHDEIY